MIVYCRLQISKSYRKTSRTRQLITKVEKVVTMVQEWLEGEDKLPSKAVGYGFVILVGIFMLCQVVRVWN